MKINSINSAMPVYTGKRVSKIASQKVQKNGMNLRVISMSEYMASPLSFKGRNKEQAIFYGAEVAPYSKAGGVGVVMKDYGLLLNPKDEVVVSPYYGGTKDENKRVVPLKDEANDYVLKVGDNFKKLDLVAEKTMQWGKKTDEKIMLFRLRDEEEKVHYFVFDESVAEFKKPYDAPKSTSKFTYASNAKSATNGWNGDAYAKNSKAFIELLPELIADKKDFNPATVVCSDSQTAYAHEYLVQKSLDDSNYDEIKSTHIGHNLGPGYCGDTSMQNMFVNLGATPKQIELVESDPLYHQLGDSYFEPFVKETLDERGVSSATQIALHYADKERANGEGFIKSISVVAEDYAESIANNPQTAYNIHNTAKKLYDQGIFNGILNPLEDPSIDATKPLPNPRYREDCKDTDGTMYPAFQVYPENASYAQMREIKNANKQKLFERFSAKDVTIITGDPSRKAKINPEAERIYDGPIIKPELIDLIKEGKGDEVPLFVSWGRLDTQKGFDITIDAFEKFAKTPEGKNAVLVIGAGTGDGPQKSKEAQKVIDKIANMLRDPDLQGRVVHIDGWAPAYALASAADMALFTSRFEPCGLTDIEAMKYYCTPLVTNTQGFKQKNFDPRNPDEAHKATSFKTQHEFHLLKSDVQMILDAYGKDNPAPEAVEKVKAEFPVFETTDAEGNKKYDDSLFVNFAKEYNTYMGEKRKDLEEAYGKDESKYPEGWNDWDQESKYYEFQFEGFARDLKDGILAAETAEAISAYVSTPADTKVSMFENLKKLNTGWKGNANLHPSNQSSAEMYKKLHMYPAYSKPTEKDVIAKDYKFIEDTIKDRQKPDVEGRIGAYLIGALTGVAGILATRFKNAGLPRPNEELIAQVDTLTKQVADKTDEIAKLVTELDGVKALKSQAEEAIGQLKQSNNRNLAIVGAAAAVGASLVTMLASKYVNKNKEAKTLETTVTNTPVANTAVSEESTPVVQAEVESTSVASAPVVSNPIETSATQTTSAQTPVATAQAPINGNVFASFVKTA